MNASQILAATEALLADPERWTINAIAKDKNGIGLVWDDPRAIKWCLVGAIMKVRQGDVTDECRKAWTILEESLADGYKRHAPNLAMFNNSSTHAEVMDLLDRAVREARRRERVEKLEIAVPTEPDPAIMNVLSDVGVG